MAASCMHDASEPRTACVFCVQMVSAPEMPVPTAVAQPTAMLAEPVGAGGGGGGAPGGAGSGIDEDLQVGSTSM